MFNWARDKLLGFVVHAVSLNPGLNRVWLAANHTDPAQIGGDWKMDLDVLRKTDRRHRESKNPTKKDKIGETTRIGNQDQKSNPRKCVQGLGRVGLTHPVA